MLLKGTLILVMGLGLVADAPKDEAAKKDLEKLQGDWVLQSLEHKGMKSPEEAVKTFSRKIKESTYTATWETEEGTHSVSGKMTLDPTKSPKTLEVVFTEGSAKGKKMLGIYKIEGDTQTICVGDPDSGTRPTAFDSDQGTLAVWKRAKR